MEQYSDDCAIQDNTRCERLHIIDINLCAKKKRAFLDRFDMKFSLQIDGNSITVYRGRLLLCFEDVATKTTPPLHCCNE